MTPKQRKDVYQNVTDKIISYLEEGLNKKWVRPWSCLASSGGEQVSLVGRRYNGVNQLLLSIEKSVSGYKSNRWGTYKGFQKIGAQVKKGEHSTEVIFYSKIEKEEIDPKTKKTVKKNIFIIKSYAVFNADQVSGYDEKKPISNDPEDAEIVKTFDDIEQGEIIRSMVKAHNVNLIHNNEGRAYFQPSTDKIVMPPSETFNNASRYYETLLHELTHWTGHKDRLNRDGITKYAGFGSNSYAFEELVAELGSAFTSQTLGVSTQEAIREDHYPYIKSWIQGLKDDKKAIVKASALAQASSDYLLKPILKPEEIEETQEEGVETN